MKVFTIAKWEFLTNVRRKEFIFATIGFPLFMLAIIALPVILAGQAVPKDQRIGYIDETGAFEFPRSISPMDEIEKIGPVKLPSIKYEFIPYADEESARHDLIEGRLTAYFIIPGDYLETGEIKVYSMKRGFQDAPKRVIREILIENLLKGKVDERLIERVKEPANIKAYTLNEKGEVVEKGILSFLVPFAFAFILIMSIFMSSGFLFQGVVEEKETRVIEVLLSSVSPEELMIGKVLGLGAVGLAQISAWMIIAVLPASFMFAALVLSFTTVVLALAYFLLGFLLYACLMAGIGAISTSLREGQQLAGAVSLLAALPLMFGQLIFQNPNSMPARLLSYFPFTSPVAMMGRIAMTEVPLTEILLSLGILAASALLTIKISAKVFRMGILMYGKRPAFREIWRYLREA